MGHTHTKLLAGAFSVLSVAQFFMVSNLANEFNQYTENATASIVAAAPMHMSLVRSQSRSQAQFKSNLDDRLIMKMKAAQKLHSAAGTEDSDSSESSGPRGLSIVKGPDGRQHVVRLSRPAQTSTEGAASSADAQ
jgi:hypothetical protein